jgi:dihydropteroate synthase
MEQLPAMTNKRWQLAHGRSLEFGAEALVMGILNVTPDSFADGGRYFSPEKTLAQAERMLREGAAIIDVGGESTRPGGQSVTAAEEQARILPIVEALASGGAIVSVDTYRAGTARLAVEKGAHIVNDVWGAQREPDIARVAAETGAGLLLMHTGRERRKE